MSLMTHEVMKERIPADALPTKPGFDAGITDMGCKTMQSDSTSEVKVTTLEIVKLTCPFDGKIAISDVMRGILRSRNIKCR